MIITKGYWFEKNEKDIWIQETNYSGETTMIRVEPDQMPPLMESMDISLPEIFWIGKTEVTNGEYLEFLVNTVFDKEEAKLYRKFVKEESGQNYDRWTKRLYQNAANKGIYPSPSLSEMDFMLQSVEELQIPSRKDFPVRDVSWNQAMAYCQWLSNQPKSKAKGLVYRLPTETEWIWAANGGVEQVDLLTDDEDTDEELATTYRSTKPVNEGTRNGFGLVNMGGNVAEWTMDDWEGPTALEILMAGADMSILGKAKIVKGGWVGAGSYAFELGSRRMGRQELSYASVGFRVVAVKE